MGKLHEITLTLRRNGPSEQWGFSLVGGSDVKTPLIVTRVGFGSPVEGTLHRGDIITKIGNYDSRDIRHQDAQNLFKNAGSNIKVVVQRDTNPRHNASTGSSRTSSAPYSPLSVSPHLSPRGQGQGLSPGYSPGAPALTPYYSSQMTPLDDYHFDVVQIGGQRPKKGGSQEDIHVTQQPYRTTPLVLPGAKVKREPGPTESYLRHHPNPSFRARPHHIVDTDHIYKQKVANTVLERIGTGDPNKQIVHNLYNSPIGIYSENNIVDTLQKQHGITPVRKHVKFNPAESETYKALQEDSYGDHVQEVSVAPQSRVYVPNKNVPPKKNVYVTPSPDYRSALRENPEDIQQSGSFKRLMWSVLPESHY